MKFISTLAVAALLAAPAAATTLRITVTNNQAPPTGGEDSVGGFALTPVYSAFHNGAFDSFSVGAQATSGVELLAELGDFSGLPIERTAVSPASVATAVANGRPIFGGETAVGEVTITNFIEQRFFTFLSMIVPTNDTFIGNDNPVAFNLFDDAGNFVGPQTINVTGLDIFDAGTEVNDASATGGAAFSAIANGGEGIDNRATSGGVSAGGFADLDIFLNSPTAGGFTIDPALGGAGFFLDPANAASFNVATITIEEIPAPVPLPAGLPLLLAGLGALGLARRKKAS